MDNAKKINVAFIGNSQVGKTSFIHKLTKPKANDKTKDLALEIDQHLYQRKIFSIGQSYKFRIFQLKGSCNHKQDKSSQHEIMLKDSQLVIITFDISNSQSFIDVAQKWLKFAQQKIKCKNIVLLANKIDKEVALPLTKLYDFAKSHQLKLFFSSQQMDCVRLFDEITIWHQCKIQVQNIRKGKSKDQMSKVGGFMSKLFGLNNNNGQNKEDQAIKKRKQLLQTLFSQKLVSLNLNVQGHYNQLQNKLQSIYRLLAVSPSQIKEKDKAQADLLVYSIQCRVRKLRDRLKCSQQQYQIKQEECEQLRRQCAKKQQQIKVIIQLNTEEVKKLCQKMEKIQLSWKEKTIKIKNLENETTQLNSKLEQYNRKSKQLERKLKFLQNQIRNVSQIKNSKQIIQQKRLTQSKIKQQKYQQLNSKILQLSYRIFFEQVRSLKKLKASNLAFIKETIVKYQIEKVNDMATEWNQCNKIYQFDLFNSQNFHSFIDKKQKILFVIELEYFTLTVYAPQVLKNGAVGKKGVLILINKQNNQTIELQTKQQQQLWKYDPLTLNFSKGQIVIKFNKDQCNLVINEKKHKLFKRKQNSNIFEILGLKQTEQRITLKIILLEIFQISFK